MFFKDKSNIQKDTLIMDYMKKIEKDINSTHVVYIATHKLQNKTMSIAQKHSIIESFDAIKKKYGGEIFSLHNEDIIFFYKKSAYEEIQTCIVKIKFLFQNDNVLKNVEKNGFIKLFELDKQNDEFINTITYITKGNGEVIKIKSTETKKTQKPLFTQKPIEKIRRGLSPLMLARVQKSLSMVDFSSYIRRQAICAVIGNSKPQMIFEEVYVSIPDLRDSLLPDVDLTANPWLFQSLTETLDKRVLETISRHDDGSLTGNFSININISTILSDEFLEFDDNINASMRSSIILELQLVDMFSDIKSFILAKSFAQARGYKVCLDGISVDKLKYLNRESLSCDLIKIIWHSSFMDIIKEDTHFTDYTNKAERAKMILCRVDDPDAVKVGNALGINLYQGRYVQKLLNMNPKKVPYEIK